MYAMCESIGVDSLRALAKHAGISHRTLHEQVQKNRPQMDTVAQLAGAFRLSIDQLVEVRIVE